jgi:uncharacterized protein (DUF4415 family)
MQNVVKRHALFRRERQQNISKLTISNESLTDWERLDAMTDEALDLSDILEISPEMFAKAVVKQGVEPSPGKQQITIRIDSDVLEWFRAHGRGYQTRINALLQAYMEAHD